MHLSFLLYITICSLTMVFNGYKLYQTIPLIVIMLYIYKNTLVKRSFFGFFRIMHPRLILPRFLWIRNFSILLNRESLLPKQRLRIKAEKYYRASQPFTTRRIEKCLNFHQPLKWQKKKESETSPFKMMLILISISARSIYPNVT